MADLESEYLMALESAVVSIAVAASRLETAVAFLAADAPKEELEGHLTKLKEGVNQMFNQVDAFLDQSRKRVEGRGG
jgi:hypothetical protein